MKKIIFIRPAPYSDLIQGKSLIESFDLVGSRSENPALFSSTLGVKNKIEHVINKFDLKNFKVISSPALRTQETAKLFEVPFDVSPLLQEFKFSLTDTLSQSLTNSENIDVNKLRKSLIDAFLDGKMEEKPRSFGSFF